MKLFEKPWLIDHVSVITDEDTDLMVDEFIAVETRT